MSSTILEYPTQHNLKMIHISWTSDEVGAIATGTTTNKYSGQLVKAQTIPSTTAVPLNNYDITISDEDKLSLGMGNLQNRSSTLTQVVTTLGSLHNSTIGISVASAGISKKGILVLWIQGG